MKYLNFLIKPASSLCNLRCRYCFYADISRHRTEKSMGIMQPETVRLFLQQVFSQIEPGGNIHFAFQGGEPAVAGLSFFQDFTDQVASFHRKDVAVSYSIQTNGTLLDARWADFLKQHDFLVGISMDGYKDLHNHYRVDSEGNGTWNTVFRTFQMLKEAGVRTNVLCVVTGQCAKHPEKVYRELKKIGAEYMQFIPCLDPLDVSRGSMPYSLSPKAYGRFLCRLFDLWYEDWAQKNYHSIRLFDDYINIMLDGPSGTTCSTCGQCGNYFVVEGDGSVYPCDFFVLDQWKMGNIKEDDLAALAAGKQAAAFLQWGREKPAECAACRWRSLCNGGCKNDWERSGPPRNHYCEALRTFLAHAETRLRIIARAELQARRTFLRHLQI